MDVSLSPDSSSMDLLRKEVRYKTEEYEGMLIGYEGMLIRVCCFISKYNCNCRFKELNLCFRKLVSGEMHTLYWGNSPTRV